MSKTAPFDRALASFPKLYHYIPPLPKTLKVGQKNVDVKSPRDTTLWLLETLAIDSKQSYCLQDQLQALVQRCHPGMTKQRFSRLTTELHNEDFIVKSPHPSLDGPGRNNELTLTRLGKRVLAAIKTERRKTVVSFFFKGLTQDQQSKLADNLEVVAARTWEEIKKAIPDPTVKRRTRR